MYHKRAALHAVIKAMLSMAVQGEVRMSARTVRAYYVRGGQRGRSARSSAWAQNLSVLTDGMWTYRRTIRLVVLRYMDKVRGRGSRRIHIRGRLPGKTLHVRAPVRQAPGPCRRESIVCQNYGIETLSLTRRHGGSLRGPCQKTRLMSTPSKVFDTYQILK
ncbi:hypothetical protein GY45DRAFT_438833 [Cubamyces sp. BRFM 1775]|nr:hypothetical protein GY45DRAFT_438833 [Cubamyces sp. BRFM 1775]